MPNWTRPALLRGFPGFGWSVALSSDGNTAIVGDSQGGQVWFFAHDPTTNRWTESGTLTDPAADPSPKFGWSVAISGDGSTALIGDQTDNQDGAAYVATETDGTWVDQPLTPPSSLSSGAFFGESVALSADGKTALVTAPQDTEVSPTGTAWIYTSNDGSWSETAGPLTANPSDSAGLGNGGAAPLR